MNEPPDDGATSHEADLLQSGTYQAGTNSAPGGAVGSPAPTGKKRILFVDDELPVLDGIRNLLRKERKRWDMVFVASAGEALRVLEREHFDVVVSDMRMPVVDGAAFLAQVRERYPAAARIVLSGHGQREAVMRALPVTHQFLSKPCEAGVLRATIVRACELHRLLADHAIRKLVGGLDRLPSVPQAYWDLTQATSNPNVGLPEVSKIVESDPAMSAKVLQIVNSPFFGLSKRITAIHPAVTYLGMDLVKGLAITAHLLADAEFPEIEGFSPERLRQASIQGATLAKRFLAEDKSADEAFTSGLVRDIGQIVLVTGLPDRYRWIVRSALESGRPLHAVEREHFGVSHAEVGAYLLGIWGLPLSIVETVARHHAPGAAGEGPPVVLAAVHVADACVEARMTGASTETLEASVDHEFLERAGLSSELPRWLAIAKEQPSGRVARAS